MRVRVPATTANLGSGFDCVGLAIDWYDELELTLGGEGVRVDVTGEGAEQVPLDETHLVVATIRRGLEEWGDGVLPPMRLRSHNTIPHSRGLGSSASAIVAGLALAWGIARDEPLDLQELGRLSSILEGHADNAAASVYGGATLGWIEDGDVTIHPLRVHDDLVTRVWVPELEVLTKGARAVLPERVTHRDAVAQAASAATLILALDQRPDLLLKATADRLHQRYRADMMRGSYDLMEALRDVRVPATISGAGPTVIAVGTSEQLAVADEIPAGGFAMHELGLGRGVELWR
ncbi:MAG: homoserine kinase [Propionibacterium sp.]|nr:homoserine kinase [Propionibacterium sp.]